jgi:hypothetical protein
MRGEFGKKEIRGEFVKEHAQGLRRGILWNQ